MSERDEARFEGMVLAKLSALEERLAEVLEHVRTIQKGCIAEKAAHAWLMAEVRALREKANFNTRIIWSAVAWIIVAALGMLLAAFGVR